MNRKLLASLGIIALLAVALFILTRERGADLPRLKPWSGETEEIVIKRPGDTVRLFREDGAWFLGDAKYPADPKAVAGLEGKMKGLALSDLISEREHYERYDLGKDRAIEVAVRAGGREVRRVFIGKKSGTYRHTYVRLSDRPAVYLAEGALTDEFGKPFDDFRNREIFSAAKSDIRSIEIRFGPSLVTLEKIDAPKKEPADAKAGKDGKGGDAPKEERWVCRQCAGAADDARIGQIAGSFAPFAVAAFPAIEKKALGPARCTLRIKTGEKNIELAFHSKMENNRYLGASSESPYVFAVDAWKAERYFVAPNDLREKK